MASQSTYNYTVLPEQAQEDDLHATRLLHVEEKAFERVRNRLLSETSLLKLSASAPPQSLPSPPPDNTTDDPSLQGLTPADHLAHHRRAFREEVLLDFAALESSLLRIQLITTSNARERDRYAAEKAKILSTARAVRENTAALRVQLAEAQRLLLLRKGYDELAARLIDPRKLRGRAEIREEMGVLGKEIEELEGEGREVEGLWEGRREVWGRVVREGEAAMRVVKGIKEEVEVEAEKGEDEGMEDVEAEEGGNKLGERSRIASPAPGADGRTPVPEREMTPLREEGEESDAPPPPTSKFLELHDEDAARLSSQDASPMTEAQDVDMAMEGDDAPLQPQPKTTAGMEVSGEQVATPAEGMEETDDQQPMAAIGLDVEKEDLHDEAAVAVVPMESDVQEEEGATPAEEMDES